MIGHSHPMQNPAAITMPRKVGLPQAAGRLRRRMPTTDTFPYASVW